MNKKQAIGIIQDREVLGLSYRILGKKYGVSHATVCRIIMSKQKKQDKVKQEKIEAGTAALPDDVQQLKEELRKARLKIELQDIMIDIASKELGVDIRKKSGTRQSK
jgi:transposase